MLLYIPGLIYNLSGSKNVYVSSEESNRLGRLKGVLINIIVHLYDLKTKNSPEREYLDCSHFTTIEIM